MDTKLSRSQQAVQAAHAVAQWCIEHGASDEWENGTLVILRAKDRWDLAHIEDQARHLGRKTSCFHEPDLEDRLTAVAVLAGAGAYNDRKLL